jgi:hypothetical protein
VQVRFTNGIERNYMSTELDISQDSKMNSLALLTDPARMQSIMSVAKIMASATVTVPKHLQGKEGDCMAIVMQAANWGMNPFAVAQKTHLVNGVLGYEAQLINAVVQSQGFIDGTFKYEYQGEGASIKCRVGAIIRGQKEYTWGEWLSAAEITTKNSPLWKTNPKQQIGYLQVKNWTRAYFPAAILGVYTQDELETIPQERDITPDATKETVYFTDAEFEEKSVSFKSAYLKGVKKGSSVNDFYAWVETKGKKLTDNQKAEIALWKEPEIIQGESTVIQNDFVAEMNAAESEQ